MKLLKNFRNLLYYDEATVHTARFFLNMNMKDGTKSKTSLSSRPDLLPIENAFGWVKEIMEDRPSKTLAHKQPGTPTSEP